MQIFSYSKVRLKALIELASHRGKGLILLGFVCSFDARSLARNLCG
jgi:hypothetical protein